MLNLAALFKRKDMLKQILQCIILSSGRELLNKWGKSFNLLLNDYTRHGELAEFCVLTSIVVMRINLWPYRLKLLKTIKVHISYFTSIVTTQICAPQFIESAKVNWISKKIKNYISKFYLVLPSELKNRIFLSIHLFSYNSFRRT